ncbi:cytochrome P450 [Actinacidiphila acididurans]|uniref:Cytochrome P450 n=1 Tax=Actinacidiphila acididurans TaxID=2784346 RepID=A0ABS2U536_9ACTN|nr:cytochrome P450 [Actinacidiphila acididurans]MBM9510737.1 cytochrome P450 [Actinacidiphila acididurans]
MNDREPQWTAGGPDIDLADPAFYTGCDYPAVWQQARRSHPIAWSRSARAGDFWSVTTHALGSRVAKQSALFSSARGMRLGAAEAGVGAAANRMLVVSDSDAHRRIRSALSGWFTGRAVAALQDRLAAHVDELVRTLVERGTPIDVRTELAETIPTWVLFEMLDIPGPDRAELAGLTGAAFDETDLSEAAAARRAGAHAQIFGYFHQLLQRRRAAPGSDIISSLAVADGEGKRLDDVEILLNCNGLMNGGLETTPHAVTGAVLAFARDPRAWRRLAAEQRLIDGAIDEILRVTSPPMHIMRTATADTELGGATIRAHDRVVVWLPSCNWDESVFDDPRTLSLDRQGASHLSFGAGPHYCIGAVLARMELRCWLRAMLRYVERIEVTGPVRRQASTFLHGLSELKATFVPAHGRSV